MFSARIEESGVNRELRRVVIRTRYETGAMYCIKQNTFGVSINKEIVVELGKIGGFTEIFACIVMR